MKSYPVLLRFSLIGLLVLFVSVGFAQENQKIKIAENLFRAKQYENALTIFQEQYEKGNYSNRIIRGISSCLTELGQHSQQILFLKDVTKKIPDIFSYSIDLGRAYFLNDQIDSALYCWERIYTFEPPDLMRHRLTAQAMTSFRLFDEAIDVYSRALRLIPGQETIHLDIARLYRAQLNYEKASEHYLYYYQKFPKQRSYVRSLLIDMARDDEATDRIIITILNFIDDNEPDLKELLANLYMRKKNYEKAFEIVLEIQDNLPKNNLSYLTRFANEAAKDKAYVFVIKAYEFALQEVDIKLTDQIKFKLAQAYYHSSKGFNYQDETQEADSRITKALDILKELHSASAPVKYQALELYSDIYKNHFNDLDIALGYYQQINLKVVGSIQADQVRLKIADTYLLKNNLIEAEKYYKEVKNKKYLPLAQYNLAELQYFNGRFSKAKKSYDMILSQVGMRDSLANNALDRKFQIDQFRTDSINFAKFSKAALYQRQKKYSEAAKEFKELYFNTNITSFSAGMEAVLLYNKINKIEESNIILEDIVISHPEEDKTDYAYFLLANNYRQQGELEKALFTYQQILFRFSTSFYIEKAREYAREINTVLQEKVNN